MGESSRAGGGRAYPESDRRRDAGPQSSRDARGVQSSPDRTAGARREYEAAEGTYGRDGQGRSETRRPEASSRAANRRQ